MDLFVPSATVKQVQRFFLREVARKDHQLALSDYEGFEAEVYFRFDTGLIGLVRALLTCNDGTLVSFEVFDPS